MKQAINTSVIYTCYKSAGYTWNSDDVHWLIYANIPKIKNEANTFQKATAIKWCGKNLNISEILKGWAKPLPIIHSEKYPLSSDRFTVITMFSVSFQKVVLLGYCNCFKLPEIKEFCLEFKEN